MSLSDDGGYDGATCSCGSSWFRIVPNDGEDQAAFSLDDRGIVTGYSGKPVCAECSEPWQPPRERLRVVE